MIIKPLQKIEIVKGDNKYKKGSTGYFAYQTQINSCNIWSMIVVFNRIGKKGQPRIFPSYFDIPIVDPGGMIKSNRDVLNTVEKVEGLMPQNYQTDSFNCVTFKSIQPDHKNIMSFDTWEFMAYITALSLLIDRLVGNILDYLIGPNNIAVPGILIHIKSIPMPLVHAAIASINEISHGNIGPYITKGLGIDKKQKHIYYEMAYINHFNDMSNRKYIVEMLKTLIILQTEYNRYQALGKATVVSMKERIRSILTHYKQHKEQLSDLKEDQKDGKRSILQSMRGRPRPIKFRKIDLGINKERFTIEHAHAPVQNPFHRLKIASNIEYENIDEGNTNVL